MPLAVYILGLSVFCIGTSEFMISGLLPVLAADMSVSIPDVGLLISGYALGVVVGGPVLTVCTLWVPRKAALVALLSIFVAGQTIGALAPSYGVLMVGRVVAALAQGAFFGLGSLVAVTIANTDRRGRALAVMFAGLTVANVLGVPVGTFVGQHSGWRTSFWAVDALAAATLLGVALLVPYQPHDRWGGGIRSEFIAFRRPPLWVALTTSMLTQAGIFCCFSYLSPLLTDVSGFSPGAVSPLLMLFGLGGLIGNLLGARFVDRHLLTNLCVGIIAMVVVLALLALGSHSKAVTITTVAAFGLAAFSINPALQAQVIRKAGTAPALATTANTSAFNVGNTVGPWVGGSAISSGLGYVAPAWIGALLGVAALAAVAMGGLRGGTSTAGPSGTAAVSLPGLPSRRSILRDENTRPVLDDTGAS